MSRRAEAVLLWATLHSQRLGRPVRVHREGRRRRRRRWRRRRLRLRRLRMGAGVPREAAQRESKAVRNQAVQVREKESQKVANCALSCNLATFFKTPSGMRAVGRGESPARASSPGRAWCWMETTTLSAPAPSSRATSTTTSPGGPGRSSRPPTSWRQWAGTSELTFKKK